MKSTAKTGFRIALALTAILIVAAISALALVSYLGRPGPSIPADGALYTVKPGASASTIAWELEDSGLVRSGAYFRLLARLDRSSGGLKAGTYRIEASMGTRAVLDLLESGRQAYVRVTVPEGYTLRQVGLLLESAGILKAADFVAAAKDPALLGREGLVSPSFEGRLYPDTYFFPVRLGAAEAVSLMYRTFQKRLAENFPESAGLSPEELEKRLVVASIVEREYRIAEEAPLMASVFYNRLRIGMALQSCATVVYVITEKLGKPHPDVIYDRDLKLADPYNTYAQRGLPPGPICSPGLTALAAAFRPATSKYLYFRLVDADAGRHHFSASLEEHNGAAALIVKKVGK